MSSVSSCVDQNKRPLWHQWENMKSSKIFWPNVILKDELFKQIGMSMILETIQKRRLGWLGHVLCIPPPTPLPKVALWWTPQGKWNRDQQKENWKGNAPYILKIRGLTMETAPQVAADRDRSRLKHLTGQRGLSKWSCQRVKSCSNFYLVKPLKIGPWGGRSWSPPPPPLLRKPNKIQ